jgi:hypothetical protein
MATTLRARPAASTNRIDDVDSALALAGICAALLLMTVAVFVPRLADWDVHLLTVPPLHADWDPRVGVGTVPALLLGGLGVRYGFGLARELTWSRLLLASYVVAVCWLAGLAMVDGSAGIGRVLDTSNEYLATARSVTGIHDTLHEFVSRIPLSAEDNWPVHVAGHPPGALLFFVALVAAGLGSGLAAGWVVVLLAASTPVAILITLRRLGVETYARRAAPLLVLAPAAVWMAVSADAVFAACGASAMAALAAAATSSTRPILAGWSVTSGLLLGCCVMMSYGLPLLSLLGLAVLVAAGRWAPLPWVVGAGLAVVVGFALAGFAWWDAYPALYQRYWDGVAHVRPFAYWGWGNLAALCFSAGPVVGASMALAGRRAAVSVHAWRDSTGIARSATQSPQEGSSLRPPPLPKRGPSGGDASKVVWLLTCAGVAMVAIADASAMSKAEVERIWLPFVPWLLVGSALLPPRWQRPALVIQVATALLVQHLLFTNW